MSKRQFISTLLLLILMNLAIKACFIFGIDLQVQQRVGQSAYGLYFLLLNLCYIFQIINDFGLNFIHNTDTAASGHVKRDRLRQILQLKIVLAVVYTLVVTIVATTLGYMNSMHILLWLVLNNILVSLIMLLRAGISGVANYKTEAIISVMDKVLMIIFCGALLIAFSGFRIEWFVWAQTASLVITTIVAWSISSKFISKIKSEISGLDWKSIFREAAPFALMIFLMFIYTRSDSILISKIHTNGTEAVGVYAAGFRLLDAANMIAILFSPLLIPMYVRLRNDRKGTIGLMRLASGIMIFMTGLISMASLFWAKEIMTLCYGPVDDVWVNTFRLLILCHIPIGLMYIYGSFLSAMKQITKQNVLFIFSVALNLILNFVLIPIWGTTGAATAAFITQSLTTTGLIVLTILYFKEKPDLPYLFRAALYFFTLSAAGFLLILIPVHWVLQLMIFGTVAVIAAFFLKLLQWESFRELIIRRQEL